MKTLDKRIELLKKYQAEMDHRTEVENEAVRLMEEGQFKKAEDLLRTLNDNIITELQRELEELSAPKLETEKQVAVGNMIELEETNKEKIGERMQKYQEKLDKLTEPEKKSEEQKISKVKTVEEKVCKTVKKSLNFEKSGETLTIEISVENVSPVHEKKLKDFFDTLYRDTLAEFTA